MVGFVVVLFVLFEQLAHDNAPRDKHQKSCRDNQHNRAEKRENCINGTFDDIRENVPRNQQNCADNCRGDVGFRGSFAGFRGGEKLNRACVADLMHALQQNHREQHRVNHDFLPDNRPVNVKLQRVFPAEHIYQQNFDKL